MFIVGLTGGIASGKTTVAEDFAELGATIVDTDEGARAVVTAGEAGHEAVIRAFGNGIVAADGGLDRRRLRNLVFRDADARKRLESLLHPLIEAWALEQVRQAPGPYVILVVPLLVESERLRRLMNRILVVDLPEDVQLARLMQRDGCTETEARAMLAAQSSRHQRLAIADDVLDNRGAPDEIRPRIEALHRTYLSLAANVSDNAGQDGGR